MEKITAEILPDITAGSICRIFIVPCFQRNRQHITELGIKNNKLILLATAYSVPSTKVSHSISKLPPPTPSPDKNPRILPTITEYGKLFNINIVSLPIEQRSPAACAATMWGCVYPKYLPPVHPGHCRSNRGEPAAKGSYCIVPAEPG